MSGASLTPEEEQEILVKLARLSPEARRAAVTAMDPAIVDQIAPMSEDTRLMFGFAHATIEALEAAVKARRDAIQARARIPQFDKANEARRAVSEGRAERARSLRDAGKSREEIAKELDVSERSVTNYLRPG
jgi:hypothetical protein